MNIKELSTRIHRNNEKWWVDLQTGERIKRNEGEIIALVHSEISEAFQGYQESCADDHLHDREMEEVELADTIIRIMDFIGGTGIADEVGVAIMSKLNGWNPFFPDDFAETKFLKMHGHASDWLEAARKGKKEASYLAIARLILSIEEFAYKKGFRLMEAIEDKLAYNLQRADHKIENRQAEGGKAF